MHAADPRPTPQQRKGRTVPLALVHLVLLTLTAGLSLSLLAARASSGSEAIATTAEPVAAAAAATAAAAGKPHTATHKGTRKRGYASERPTPRLLQEPSEHAEPNEQQSRRHGRRRNSRRQQHGQEGGRQEQPQPSRPRQRPGLRSSWAISEEEASWVVPPRYSTHTCIGPKPEDRWQAATCKFENMCLNASTLEFEYYMDTDMYPSMPVAYNQMDAQPQEQFSEHLLSAVQWMMNKNKTAGWRPVVKRQPFPQMGGRVRWAPVPQALLQGFPQRFLVNFGHVMFDLAVPLFNAQHLFGVYRPDAQVLVLNQTLNDKWEDVDHFMERMINTPDPSRSLFRLSWDSDALWLRNYTRALLGDEGDGLICFRSVLAGTGNLTRRGRATDALPYRAAIAERLDLQEEPYGHEDQVVITLLDKEGRRIIENYDEVMQMLQQRYPLARVQLMDFGKHPNLTMAEQVELMSETSILISPCGGLATVLAFLRPGATAIVMNFWHTHLNRSVMMEDAFYSNLEYLDLQYFPVSPADYEGTSDRPECELIANGTRRHDSRYPQSGGLVNCNLHFGPEARQRMANYVDQAVMRWAARQGRYGVLEPLREYRAAELDAAAELAAGAGGLATGKHGLGGGGAEILAGAVESASWREDAQEQ